MIALRLRSVLTLACSLLLAGIMSACAPLQVLNQFVPPENVMVTRDIAFSTATTTKLDVYRSVAIKTTAESSITPNAPKASKPVVIFFYGGAWNAGDKESYFFMGEALTSRGYVVVMPNYRLYPEVIFPAYMDDAADAVKWTVDNISSYGGNAEQIFVMGHSAGAQLAALVAYDTRYLQRVGVDRQRIRGVISLAGPLDFLPLTEPELFLIFPEPVRAASQPINFIVGNEPPTLVMHGEADTRVGIHNSRNLAARIRERGGRVEETYYPGVGHPGILLQFASPLREGKPFLNRVAQFIDTLVAEKRK
jgi:acetyl esterase/lipase